MPSVFRATGRAGSNHTRRCAKRKGNRLVPIPLLHVDPVKCVFLGTLRPVLGLPKRLARAADRCGLCILPGSYRAHSTRYAAIQKLSRCGRGRKPVALAEYIHGERGNYRFTPISAGFPTSSVVPDSTVGRQAHFAAPYPYVAVMVRVYGKLAIAPRIGQPNGWAQRNWHHALMFCKTSIVHALPQNYFILTRMCHEFFPTERSCASSCFFLSRPQ
jgi:hypothetical protein